MAYTHTIELSLDGVRIQGEIDLDITDPMVKIEGDVEMSVSERAKIQQILERIVGCHKELGKINKIEIVPKA